MAEVPLLILSGFATHSSFRRFEWKQLNLIKYLGVNFTFVCGRICSCPCATSVIGEFAFEHHSSIESMNGMWCKQSRLFDCLFDTLILFEVNSQFAICLRSPYTHHNDNCTRTWCTLAQMAQKQFRIWSSAFLLQHARFCSHVFLTRKKNRKQRIITAEELRRSRNNIICTP